MHQYKQNCNVIFQLKWLLLAITISIKSVKMKSIQGCLVALLYIYF